MSETTIHPALDEFDAAMREPRQRLAALAAETRRECAAMVKREVRLAKSETRSGVNNAILLDLAERMGRGE